MDKVEFVKENLLDEIYRIYDSKMDDEDFEQGTQHEIFTDEGKVNIEAVIMKVVTDELDYRLYEYRKVLSKLEILRQLGKKLLMDSEGINPFHEEISLLSDELHEKFNALRTAERLYTTLNK